MNRILSITAVFLFSASAFAGGDILAHCSLVKGTNATLSKSIALHISADKRFITVSNDRKILGVLEFYGDDETSFEYQQETTTMDLSLNIQSDFVKGKTKKSSVNFNYSKKTESSWTTGYYQCSIVGFSG